MGIDVTGVRTPEDLRARMRDGSRWDRPDMDRRRIDTIRELEILKRAKSTAATEPPPEDLYVVET